MGDDVPINQMMGLAVQTHSTMTEIGQRGAAHVDKLGSGLLGVIHCCADRWPGCA